MDDSESNRWTRQGLQLPPNIAKQFKDLAATQAAFGGVQVMGTAAIALFVGMPKDLRDAVCDYVVRNAWKGLEGVQGADTWHAFAEAMVAEINRERVREKTPGEPSIEHPDRLKFYIDRILDPELTPPPGEKLSDRRPQVPPIDPKKIPKDRKSG